LAVRAIFSFISYTYRHSNIGCKTLFICPNKRTQTIKPAIAGLIVLICYLYFFLQQDPFFSLPQLFPPSHFLPSLQAPLSSRQALFFPLLQQAAPPGIHPISLHFKVSNLPSFQQPISIHLAVSTTQVPLASYLQQAVPLSQVAASPWQSSLWPLQQASVCSVSDCNNIPKLDGVLLYES
jgi:hypothetical protein